MKKLKERFEFVDWTNVILITIIIALVFVLIAIIIIAIVNPSAFNGVVIDNNSISNPANPLHPLHKNFYF